MMPRPPLELWAGLECTINRVGDRFHDQLARCGAYARPDDVARFAPLGIRALRWPALWERIAPNGVASADWRWSDETLPRIHGAGIEPIVGLVHHGSGPASTDLLDARFASGLAEYAAAFAARYPWVRRYTPVNEPLTTARFSALYGHWYPHARGDRPFVDALVNQCRASVQAFAAVRTVNPDAELVLTEDAGSTRGTDVVASQVAFENERRWLSLDLLTGRVDAAHPMYGYLHDTGITDEDLEWFRAHAVTPAIVGLNYYVTSDRFLDHRLQRYPPHLHGGNGRQRYVDVEAARIDGVGIRGHAAVLDEAWRRYGVPVAITEAHLGCSREEQMRWLHAAWLGAMEARSAGADVRAVTAWALLGSWDWDSLVTADWGHYEPGLFDVRSDPPRATALVHMARAFAAGTPVEHPVLASRGWWACGGGVNVSGVPIAIVGATGTLGRAFAYACELRGLAYVLLSRRDLDIVDPDSVRAALAAHQPWAVVNAAGYVRVDDAEREPGVCRRVNAVGPAILAMACRRARIPLMTFSSDLVFDGTMSRPYVEQDRVAPLNIYGHSKVEAERRVLAIHPEALVIRTSAFFGPWDRYNFVTCALQTLAARQPFVAPSDMTVSPTYVPDLVAASLDLLIDRASGVWHLANTGEMTWADLARSAAILAGADASLVDARPSASLALPARRPAYSVLGTARGCVLPSLDDSLARYVRDRDRLDTAA